METLNLGCGNRILPGAVNVDVWKHRPEVDVVHDLNVLPWPWRDGCFDKIAALAVFEHLRIDLVTAMDEVWRLLRPGGLAVVKVPFWKAPATHQDPRHYWRGFTLATMEYFDPRTELGRKYAFYTRFKWRIVKGPRLNRSRSSIWTTLRKIPHPARALTPGPSPNLGRGGGLPRRGEGETDTGGGGGVLPRGEQPPEGAGVRGGGGEGEDDIA